DFMGMAYDAARNQVVLFGGGDPRNFADTWTWDGVDWTQRTPAHSPSGRRGMGMTYDAARTQVVMFGGYNGGFLADTWTWDGTDWTQRFPARRSSGLDFMGMAYDAARAQVVLFGGIGERLLADTWTWDGTDWTHRTAAHAPTRRFGMGMTYDAARSQVVLFGGITGPAGSLGDTWTWDGTDWAIPFRASLTVTPESGPPGTLAMVHGSGFGGGEEVVLIFIDSVTGITKLRIVKALGTGSFTKRVIIPLNATVGTQHVRARARGSGQSRRKDFTVT